MNFDYIKSKTKNFASWVSTPTTDRHLVKASSPSDTHWINRNNWNMTACLKQPPILVDDQSDLNEEE